MYGSFALTIIPIDWEELEFCWEFICKLQPCIFEVHFVVTFYTISFLPWDDVWYVSRSLSSLVVSASPLTMSLAICNKTKKIIFRFNNVNNCHLTGKCPATYVHVHIFVSENQFRKNILKQQHFIIYFLLVQALMVQSN